MRSGEIVSIVEEKGFGFVKPTTGGADMFFHSSAVDGEFEALAVGQEVQFEIDESADKPRAKTVKPTGAPPTTAKRSAGRSSAGGDRHSGPKRFGSDRPRGGADRSRGGGRQGGPARGPASVSRTQPYLHAEYGFVTKIHRKENEGFISANNRGPELVFDASEVSGEKSFARMNVGDYVRFERCKQPVDPAIKPTPPPVAKNVQIAERRPPKPGPELPANPKSRRRKPTWR